MYSGRITEIGSVAANGSDGLVVEAPKAAGRLEVGGSFCVNGVCLSATDLDGTTVQADVSPETARRSTLDGLQSGQRVNVETPLRVGDVLDGHLVQGHVDAVGKVVKVVDERLGRRLWIRPPARVLESLVPKGSVALDGVSLTVAEIIRDRFSVALIPAPLADTTLGDLVDGARVNLEVDLVASVARRYPEQPATAVAAVIGSLPWAGALSGRLGVEKAVAQLGAGGGVIVWDPVREGEGDVVFAGADLRPEAFVFLLTQACGHTTVPCDRPRLERLEVPPMPGAGDRQGTAMHTSIDLSAGTGTGISAAGRAATPPSPCPPVQVRESRRPSAPPPFGGWRQPTPARRTFCTLATCSRWPLGR